MTTKDTNAVAETNTNAAAAPAAAPAAPAAPSKMDKAKALFSGLKDGSIPLMEGKTTARSSFIATMQLPGNDMSQSGAATYWQNLVSLDKGGKLYPHTGSKKTAAAAAAPAASTGPAEDAVPADVKAEGGEQAPADAEEGGQKSEDDLSHLEG